MNKPITFMTAVAAFSLSTSAASAQSSYPATELRGPQNNQQVGLLLPAVQSAREATRRPQANTAGGGLHVRVFDGRSGHRAQSDLNRRTQGARARGGVRVATGDVNGGGNR